VRALVSAGGLVEESALVVEVVDLVLTGEVLEGSGLDGGVVEGSERDVGVVEGGVSEGSALEELDPGIRTGDTPGTGARISSSESELESSRLDSELESGLGLAGSTEISIQG